MFLNVGCGQFRDNCYNFLDRILAEGMLVFRKCDSYLS